MATYEELMQSAEQIRTNELPESNTHELVGQHLKNQVEHFNKEGNGIKSLIEANKKEVDGKLTELGEKIPNTNFITCSTVNSVANKTVNILDFKLSNRVRLLIKMTNANTADNANLSISSPQLDTKPLYYNGERASSKNSWEAGAVLDVYYDGTNFQATDFDATKGISELKNKASSVGYVTCDTVAAASDKTLVVEGITALTTGIRLLIKMTNHNTSGNATLNINSLGAKPLFYNGVRVNSDNAWKDGEVIDVYYDGTNFQATDFQGGAGSEEIERLEQKVEEVGVKNEDYVEGDFGISDESGNVILELRNGHIHTKNFNSEDVGKSIEHPVETQDTEFQDTDFEVSDEGGNIIMAISNGHIKTKSFDSSDFGLKNSTKVVFERGGLGVDGRFDKSNTHIFNGLFRTGKYLEARNCIQIKSEQSCLIFEYDADFNLVATVSVEPQSDFFTLNLSPLAKYIKIKVESESYPNIYLKDVGDYVYNEKGNNGCKTALFEVQESVTGNITSGDSDDELISSNTYYGGCIYSLPYNYDPKGESCRLIIFCHETPDRVWGMQNYNNPATTTYKGQVYDLQEYTYDAIVDWLNKEGFAVFDVYGSSSKYNFDRGSLANADNVNCMVSGYNWLIKNYNISKDGVCVTGKSIGGLMAMRITMGVGIPVICSGLMVPSLCAVKRLFSYEDSTVEYYCNDMNFEDIEGNTWRILKNGTTEQKKSYLIGNFDKWCLYDPWTCCINRQDKESIVNSVVDANQTPSKWEDSVFMVRNVTVPVKIWSAIDDETQVSHYEHTSMINSIRNAGGYAELRTMPTDTGGHYSTDRSPLSIKKNIVTKLGYTCNNIPLAWIEMVNFFRSFIGINI